MWFSIAYSDILRLQQQSYFYFEGSLSDRMREVGWILKYLNLERDEARLACLQYCNVDMYKRKSREVGISPYSDKVRDIIKQNINTEDKILIMYEHPSIPLSQYKLDWLCLFGSIFWGSKLLFTLLLMQLCTLWYQ